MRLGLLAMSLSLTGLVSAHNVRGANAGSASVVPPEAGTARQGLASAATLVIVSGLGGETRFEQRFHIWAATLMDAASAHGLPDTHIIYLAATTDHDSRVRDRSTRDNVQATLAELAVARQVSPDTPTGPLFLVIIGHGSFRDGVSKVNLPGPDMTTADFRTSLEPFGDRPIVFANLTSASGEYIRELSAPGRVVITATRSGTERNASMFAQFFVAAFVGDLADADHDGRLSVLEAFNYAHGEVERAYDREQKLKTEHAMLDDNGDGDGSAEPGADADDGRLANSLTLGGSLAASPSETIDDTELQHLYRQKADLERGIAELRLRKTDLNRQDYETQLEEILIQLALTHRAIRQHPDEGGEP